MEEQAAVARLPLGPARVVREALDVRSHVAPPSGLLNKPAGSTPAYSASPGPVARFQMVAIFSPSSPYVRPSLEWLQVLPRSSLRQTAGPYQLLPPPANRAPEPGSTIASWIGQPSQSGPRTSQASRSASPSSTNRPLRVPTSSATRSVISLLRTMRVAARRVSVRCPPAYDEIEVAVTARRAGRAQIDPLDPGGSHGCRRSAVHRVHARRDPVPRGPRAEQRSVLVPAAQGRVRGAAEGATRGA